jgi:hypothetical protein
MLKFIANVAKQKGYGNKNLDKRKLNMYSSLNYFLIIGKTHCKNSLELRKIFLLIFASWKNNGIFINRERL